MIQNFFTVPKDHDTDLGWQVTIDGASDEKAALRMEMRRRLHASSKNSKELYESLKTSLEELQNRKNIAIFAALPDEPCITPLIEDLPQHCWLLPRVDGELLHFHEVTDVSTELQKGAFGIMEPNSGLPITSIPEIDIFICPGLAFDPKGGRLGRGRGFYDRILSKAREDALKMGIGFDCQMVQDTYIEEHDILMNSVICQG